MQIPFELDRDRVLEFRAIYNKACYFAVDSFTITRNDETTTGQTK